jgi:hypothetical protein
MLSLYACSGASLVKLDDPSVSTDQGSAFTATIRSVPWEVGIGEWATWRRVTQAIALTTSATITLTPIVDGADDPSLAETFSLTAADDGTTPTCDLRTFAAGTRFQLQADVTAHDGETAFGEVEISYVPRRSTAAP